MDRDEILADRRMKIRGFMGWLSIEEIEEMVKQKRIDMKVEKIEENEEM